VTYITNDGFVFSKLLTLKLLTKKYRMSKHFQILAIGGGTAGIMVSSMLKRKNSSFQIGIIEPAETHYYQPAWTLVGANTYDFDATAKSMSSLIPNGVEWIKEFADTFEPETS